MIVGENTYSNEYIAYDEVFIYVSTCILVARRMMWKRRELAVVSMEKKYQVREVNTG